MGSTTLIMVSSRADSTIALVDASKFGKRNLSPFARLDQIARIFTDGALDPFWSEQLQRTSTTLTVCGAETTSSFAPAQQDARHYRIGFANLTERMRFAVEVRHGLERAAQQAGNIDTSYPDQGSAARNARRET